MDDFPWPGANRSIQILKALNFQHYDKLKETYDEQVYNPEKCYKDFGLIAQQIQDLSNNGFPELKDLAHDIGGGLFGVRYDAIFSIVAVATQDLMRREEALEASASS